MWRRAPEILRLSAGASIRKGLELVRFRCRARAGGVRHEVLAPDNAGGGRGSLPKLGNFARTSLACVHLSGVCAYEQIPAAAPFLPVKYSNEHDRGP
jgi:hypothetical protein